MDATLLASLGLTEVDTSSNRSNNIVLLGRLNQFLTRIQISLCRLIYLLKIKIW